MRIISHNEYEICLDIDVSQEEACELARKYRLSRDTWTCSHCNMENDCVGDFECEEDWYRECFVVSFKPFRQSVFSKLKYGTVYTECEKCRKIFT